MRRLVLVLLLGLLAPAAAHAQTGALSEAERGLQGRSVYVAPGFSGFSAAGRERVEREITQRGLDLRVALFPADAGDARTLAARLYRDLGSHGTVLVAAGGDVRAGPGLVPSRALREASAANSGVEDTLMDFVARLDAARGGAGAPGSSRGVGASPLLILLLIGGGLFALSSVTRSRRRRKEEEAELAHVRETVNEDLVALGEDIRALDLDVQMPDADREGKAHYNRAVEGYDRANQRLATAKRVDDLAGVGELLEDARYEMTAAKARLAGEPVPERRPPCFFDPRHGPSVQDQVWAPYGGTEREVPVCAACATDIADGREPESRQVMVGGGMAPWWSAGGGYGGYYGGMFSPFGLGAGLLGGMMLGSMFDPDPGWADGGFGGGDFGGGDFGGGDFGGGDFGGGDF